MDLKKTILLFLMISWLDVTAQETMYIPPASTIHIGNKTPVGSFGTVINEGNLSIETNGKFYFLGKIFKNSFYAVMSDENLAPNTKQGGTVIFQQPNILYGHLGQQLVESGFVDSLRSGPEFSNVIVNNSAGIYLVSDMSVQNKVTFQRGHVYLNQYIVALGDKFNPGDIEGYDDTRYFVTGSGITGGSLKMRNLGSCCVVSFPIGLDNQNYTPVQLRNLGTTTDVSVRAFNNVYANGLSGPIVSDSILRLTWSLSTASPVANDFEVVLQHDKKLETNSFSAARNGSFVSALAGNTWDKPASIPQPQAPGTITSTFSITTAMMNARKLSLSSNPLYLTKKATILKFPVSVPNVFSPNGDGINDTWVLKFLEGNANCKVQIFDRYGNIVFNSTGYSTPWNGTLNGKPLPVSTYYYIIDLKNGLKPVSGSVTILK